MLDPETERKNLLWGWGLFVLFCLIGGRRSALAVRLGPSCYGRPRSTSPRRRDLRSQRLERPRRHLPRAGPSSPAEGIPLAVKDLFDTAGLTTTYGSAIFADHVPTATAEAVRRLEAAGYANVGKTNLHEFAYGTTSENPHFGNVPNPIAPGPGRRRVERRLRRRPRRGTRRRGARLGHRRLDPDPGRLLRRRRLQADLRARPAGRLLPAGARASTTAARWRARSRNARR